MPPAEPSARNYAASWSATAFLQISRLPHVQPSAFDPWSGTVTGDCAGRWLLRPSSYQVAGYNIMSEHYLEKIMNRLDTLNDLIAEGDDLTKRERFVMAAMQGSLSDGGEVGEGYEKRFARRCILLADIMLAELAKGGAP